MDSLDEQLNKWDELNEKIETSLVLNEKLLRQQTYGKSQSILSKVLNYQSGESKSHILGAIFLSCLSLFVWNKPGLVLSFMTAAFLLLIFWYFKKREVAVIHNINLETDSITEILEKLKVSREVNAQIFKYGLYSLAIFPLLALFLVAAYKGVNWSAFFSTERISSYMMYGGVIEFISLNVIVLIITAVIAVRLYNKNLKYKINQLIEHLENFK